MSIINLVLLMKAVNQYEEQTSSHRTKRSSTASRWENPTNDDTVTLEIFLDDYLSTDPEAASLFLLLKECKNQIDIKDYQISLEEFQQICKEYEEQEVILKNARKEAETLGIEFDDSITLDKYYCAVKTEEGKGLGNYGSYTYASAKYCMSFNKMPLTREMLEKNINQFQIDLEKFNKENPNLEEQLSEITKKINKQKKLLKYSPFNKQKKQSLLSEMLKAEQSIKEKINQRTILETQSKNFEALTPEQKQAILNYMDQVANCIEVGERLYTQVNYSQSIRLGYHGSSKIEERNLHQRIMENAEKQGKFSKEEMEIILERVINVMEKNKSLFGRYKRLNKKTFAILSPSPEASFATIYFNYISKASTKTK